MKESYELLISATTGALVKSLNQQLFPTLPNFARTTLNMGYYGLDVVDPEEALRLTDLRHNSDAFNMVYERRSVFAV